MIIDSCKLKDLTFPLILHRTSAYILELRQYGGLVRFIP